VSQTAEGEDEGEEGGSGEWELEQEGGRVLKIERLSLDREKEKDSDFSLGLREDLNCVTE